MVNNEVRNFHQDSHGDFWITTAAGLTRYRPQHTFAPAIHLTDVVADRLYESVHEVRLPSSQPFISFEFQGRSMTTPPDGMVYIYRLQGYDNEWRTTRTTEVEYTDLPSGDYVFQVKAVDRDLNYSEPAAVTLNVHPPYVLIGWISASECRRFADPLAERPSGPPRTAACRRPTRSSRRPTSRSRKPTVSSPSFWPTCPTSSAPR